VFDRKIGLVAPRSLAERRGGSKHVPVAAPFANDFDPATADFRQHHLIQKVARDATMDGGGLSASRARATGNLAPARVRPKCPWHVGRTSLHRSPARIAYGIQTFGYNKCFRPHKLDGLATDFDIPLFVGSPGNFRVDRGFVLWGLRAAHPVNLPVDAAALSMNAKLLAKHSQP
jgi:hypothetical protein